MAKQAKNPSLKTFQDYCWSFYGPGQIHGDIFGNTLTRRELNSACALQFKQIDFEGDSFDREKARDRALKARGAASTEYAV